MPIEKKSRCGARRSACSAAAGTSIIAPTSIVAVEPTARAARARPGPRRRSVTIGNITETGCSAATRRIARSCVEKRSGCASERRSPRRPRNGLASGSVAMNGSGLSAPASSVRTISGRPAEAPGDLGQHLDLLVLARAARCARGRGTPCAAARRPRRRGRPPGRHRRRCRCWRTPRRAGRRQHDRLGRACQRAGARAAAACAALLEGGRRRVGLDLDLAGLGVDGERRALRDGEQRRAEADDVRDPERAGDDRGVVERAAARGRDAPGDLRVEAARRRPA